MKTWSYKTITQKAEAEIKSLMDQSAGSKEDDFKKQLFMNWAYGVFLGWKELTMGWQIVGDCERMEELTKRKSL